MADADYRRLAPACACGAELVSRDGAGKLPRYCLPCKRGGVVQQEKTCAQCSARFMPSMKIAMYCGKACKQKAWSSKQPPGKLAKLVPKFSPYHARLCACGAPHASRDWWKVCPACRDHEARARKAAEARKSLDRDMRRHRADAVVVCCEGCGLAFCPTYGSKSRRYCAPCGAEADLAMKRAHRIARKLRERCARVEAVDPIKVFKRDRWTCRLCGVKTPEKLRGTYQDRAPELDHIVPISKGGEHSYRNTQCACRRCNGLKSDRPMGQTLLFG